MAKQTAEEMLEGETFYPHECGGMIECITKQDAIKFMNQFAEQSQWIDVNDKEKPPISQTVILTDGIIQYMGFYSDNHKWMLLGQAVRTESKTKITHWKYQDNLPKTLAK